MSEYGDFERKSDFNYFVDHYQELYKQYGHKFIALKDRQVLGSYDTELDAIQQTSEKYPLGTFIVQECNGDESGYTNYISSWHLVNA